MSQYFTAVFFSESGFPSKAAFQEFSIKEQDKTEPINKQLTSLVKQGQTLVKNLYTENQVQIKRLDQERKATNKFLQAQDKTIQKKVAERYMPVDLSDEEVQEITSYQPTNPLREFHKDEINRLLETIQQRDETIAALELENSSLWKQNGTLTQHYKMLRNAYVDITIEYETVRSTAPLPMKRKRSIIQ